MAIRRLKPGDENKLESFLKEHAYTSMHMRSNVKRAGLNSDDENLEKHQGIYYAYINSNEDIEGVIAYFWNKNIIMQTGPHLKELFKALADEDISFHGLLGPASQVRRVIDFLSVPEDKLQVSWDEKLYALQLDKLKTPAPLENQEVQVRGYKASDKNLVLNWRKAFSIESLNAKDDELLDERARQEIERMRDDLSLLVDQDKIVAMCSSDTALPDSVNIGAVYTPPEHRSNGYARAVVAGSLINAQKLGATRSILFTNNPAAAKAYTALGYEQVDEYGLTLLSEPEILLPK